MDNAKDISEANNVININNKVKISLVIKVTALISISIVLVASISTLIIYNLSYKALRDEISEKILLLASVIAASIDGDMLSSIKTSDDEGSGNYKLIQKKLQNIKEDSKGKIRYIYAISKSSEDKYIYVMDASPKEDIKNHSTVGDLFDTKIYPIVLEGFKKPVVEKAPTPDNEFGGLTQSGFAPIKNKAGEIVAVLGVDIDVTVILNDTAEMKHAHLSAMICSILLAILLGFIFSRYLTKPILILTKGTRSVAQGNLDISVNLKRNDELGLLASSFNSMTRDLNIADKALKKYNLELEEKIALRTKDLTEINKEIKDILDNISQAIFTIDRNLNFNPQYSKFAHIIFGDICFSNQNMLDILFPLAEQKSLRESMSLWLNMVFMSDSKDWINLKTIQPIREIVVYINESSGENNKYVKLEFQPVTDIYETDLKEKVSKMMLIVSDITEKKSLQMEIVKKEKEYKDNINQIVEIIKMDQELFQDFITECKENLLSFEPKLIQLKEEKGNIELVNDLSRIMHTIKGNAKIFNLERIVGEAHGIENIFTAIRKGERILTEGLLDEIFDKLDGFNALFNETMDIYYKIVENMNSDYGKTRSGKRNSEDNEVIRVRVNEINRLAELMNRADKLIRQDNPVKQEYKFGPEIAIEIESILRETNEQIKSMKKISFNRLFARFPRMIRDISLELDKKVRFITNGENIYIDKYIYDNLSEPIIHIIRNSLDHGIERPEDRVILGKTEEGLISVDITETVNDLIVIISDDGRGLDNTRIRAKAVVKGLISAEEALVMTEEEAIQLIFSPGFSTNDNISDISGRGVGMSVVKTKIEDYLDGSIKIETKRNVGTKISIIIPKTSSI